MNEDQNRVSIYSTSVPRAYAIAIAVSVGAGALLAAIAGSDSPTVLRLALGVVLLAYISLLFRSFLSEPLAVEVGKDDVRVVYLFREQVRPKRTFDKIDGRRSRKNPEDKVYFLQFAGFADLEIFSKDLEVSEHDLIHLFARPRTAIDDTIAQAEFENGYSDLN